MGLFRDKIQTEIIGSNQILFRGSLPVIVYSISSEIRSYAGRDIVAAVGVSGDGRGGLLSYPPKHDNQPTKIEACKKRSQNFILTVLVVRK